MKKQYYIDKITKQLEKRTHFASKVIESLDLERLSVEQLKGLSFITTCMELSEESLKGLKRVIEEGAFDE